MIKHDSEGGQLLQAAVETKLATYHDNVQEPFPQYVVLLVENRLSEASISEALHAFIGPENAALTASW